MTKKYIGENTKKYLSELIDDLKLEHTPQKAVPERSKLNISLFNHKLTESTAYQSKKNVPQAADGKDDIVGTEDEKKQ